MDFVLGECVQMPLQQDSLAERSKAVAQGAIPQGRGFEPRSCHLGHYYNMLMKLHTNMDAVQNILALCSDGECKKQ